MDSEPDKPTEHAETRSEPSLSPEVPQQVSHAAVQKAKSGGYYHYRLGPKQAFKLLMLVVVVALLVGVIGGVCFWAQGGKAVNENKNINASEFQALFLTNGQVYFGKLADLNHGYVTIKDIYYLQVQSGQNQNLQQGATSSSNSQVSLAKLGSELHGPEDKMYVASDQVLFWENLKNNSKVAQAIAKYQNQ